MVPQSLGERLEHLDPGRFGPGNPVLEESLRLSLVRLRPKLPEVLFHVVGGRERLVQSQGRNQTPLLVSGGIQILGILQEQPTNPLEDFLRLILSLMKEEASQVREFLVEQLDDMEVIEHDLRLGKVFGNSLLVGRRHVHRDRLDLGVRAPETLPERPQGVSAFPLADEDHGTAVEVQDQR